MEGINTHNDPAQPDLLDPSLSLLLFFPESSVDQVEVSFKLDFGKNIIFTGSLPTFASSSARTEQALMMLPSKL